MPAYTYVYILANTFKHLYVGVTSELEHRVWQHKNHAFPGSFTDRYKIDHLVYFERFGRVTAAIAREKELRGWLRIKKIELILAGNPEWKDLGEEWGKPIEPLSRNVE